CATALFDINMPALAATNAVVKPIFPVISKKRLRSSNSGVFSMLESDIIVSSIVVVIVIIWFR
ncbi:MAG: hypothetical protein ACI80S_000941, partial [Pseudohongiellaceae bacterium]